MHYGLESKKEKNSLPLGYVKTTKKSCYATKQETKYNFDLDIQVVNSNPTSNQPFKILFEVVIANDSTKIFSQYFIFFLVISIFIVVHK